MIASSQIVMFAKKKECGEEQLGILSLNVLQAAIAYTYTHIYCYEN